MKTKEPRRRSLTVEEILRWTDIHRNVTGKWPTKASGDIVGGRFETWYAVNSALRTGTRGLPGGSSVAKLLADARGVRNIHKRAVLTVSQVLQWADNFKALTGSWPNARSGSIPGSGGEKWHGVENALRVGSRGLPAGASLAKILAEHRGTRNCKDCPALTEELILARADGHHRSTGHWPKAKSGPIEDAPGETWMAADVALRNGLRGLPGGSSLALLLADRRNVRNAWTLPSLNIPQILAWADAHHQRTGQWPHMETGAISDGPGETWGAIHHALNSGGRGLPGGHTLARLLAAERGVRNKISVPKLSQQVILQWADAHYRRTGEWPTKVSGCVGVSRRKVADERAARGKA